MERHTVVVRETSLLSPLTVLLFSMGQLSVHKVSSCIMKVITCYG